MVTRVAVPFVLALLFWAVPQMGLASAPVMQSRASLLLDGTSGQVLFDQNGTARQYPASTTKLLTALVAVERGSLDQVILISDRAVAQAPDSSSCYLNRGESQRLEYLLYGLLLSSGNDCAVAIAEGVSHGDPNQFVEWMNETAKRLGATRSHFKNPHGLHDPGHYTTALDLALIARGALANPVVRQIAGTREFAWPGKNNGTYYNHNAMLFFYEGSIGGKTGYTEEARLTLVNAAEREGRLLIGIVMGEETKTRQYQDMTALLDYGFDSFEQRILVMPKSVHGTVPIKHGKRTSVGLVSAAEFLVSVPKGGEARATVIRRVPESVAAPVQVGQQVGHLEIREGEMLLGSVPLVAQEGVRATPQFLRSLGAWALVALKWLAGLVVGSLIFRIIVKTIRKAIRTMRRRRRPAGRREPYTRTTSRTDRARMQNRF